MKAATPHLGKGELDDLVFRQKKKNDSFKPARTIAQKTSRPSERKEKGERANSGIRPKPELDLEAREK